MTDGRGGAPDVGPDVAAVDRAAPERLRDPRAGRAICSGGAHDGGARAIQVFDPLSLGVLAPPGELGADIAVAEGQALGNHLNYGGPYLGLIAARLDDVRKMPGPDRGRDGRRRRQGRLRAHAAGARATHPPREGELQHLHEPDADGRRGHDLPRLARTGRARRARQAVRLEGRVRGRAAHGDRRRRPAPSRRVRSSRSSRSGCLGPATEVRDDAGRSRVPGGGAARRRRRPARSPSPSPRSDRATRSTGSRRRWRRCSRDRCADPPSGPAVGGGHDQGPVAARPVGVRVRAARRAGGVDPGRRTRRAEPGLPEVAEIDLVRHYTRLSQMNYGVDTGLLPAGLVHHEVQPEGRRDRRRAARVPADAPAAARPDGPGGARDALAARSRRSARSPGWRAPRCSRPPARAAR